jgi:hypothetical protein
MKPKVGQYWLDMRDLDRLSEKSFHGVRILALTRSRVKLQFYHYESRLPYYMTSLWDLESFFPDFKLDEHDNVTEILSYYD